MSSLRRRGLMNERGVAMVTVLFIAAALTAVTSVAAVATIQEFRAGNDDRRASGALSYAEAGIDRMLSFLRNGTLTYNELNRAGCADPPLALPIGKVGLGEFSVAMTVYDPFAATPANRLPVGTVPTTQGACANRPISPHPGQGGDKTYFLITSTGQHPAATRVLRQVIALEPIKLPIGLYANNITVQSSKHPMDRISMISETYITNREQVGFSGVDSYYKMSDFFPDGVGDRSLTEAAPTAAHAAQYIQLKRSSDLEFATATKNCVANDIDAGGPNYQSIWDSDGSAGSGAITSGCSNAPAGYGYPNSSKFTSTQLQNFAKPTLSEQDHQVLKDAGKNYGVYCSFPGPTPPGGDTSSTCWARGTQQAGTDYFTYVQNVKNGTAPQGTPGGTHDFVAYFEYRSGSAAGNNIDRFGSVWGCSDNPASHYSILVVVKNGGVSFTGAGGDQINGAMIIDGNFKSIGGFTFNGSLISKGNVHLHSSSQKFSLDPCWVKNMPGPFLQAVPGHWSEVDR